MSFLFKLILVIIFIYLIYRIAFMGRNPQNPYKKDSDIKTEHHPEQDDSVQKKIDMSNVEDADYKEVK